VSVNRQCCVLNSYLSATTTAYCISLYFILLYFIVAYFCPVPLSSFVRGVLQIPLID